MDECGVEVNGSAVELLCDGDDKKKTHSAPVNHGRVCTFIRAEQLQTPPHDKSSFEFVDKAVGSPLAFKDPGGFDNLLPGRNITSLYLLHIILLLQRA